MSAVHPDLFYDSVSTIKLLSIKDKVTCKISKGCLLSCDALKNTSLKNSQTNLACSTSTNEPKETYPFIIATVLEPIKDI